MNLKACLLLAVSLGITTSIDDVDNILQKVEEEIDTDIQMVKTAADELYAYVKRFVEETRLTVRLLQSESQPDRVASSQETRALYQLFFSGARRDEVVRCTRQKNKLDAIRLHRRDSISRCSDRVEAFVRDTESRAEVAKARADRMFTNRAANLTDKCRTMDDRADCLDAVRREAGVRVESLRRAVESARLFSSLRQSESQLGLKFCRQVTDAYAGVLKEERDALKKCIEGTGGTLPETTNDEGVTL